MSDPQEFDVDAFLADEQPTPAAFDVDAFLAEPDDSPNLQRSVEGAVEEIRPFVYPNEPGAPPRGFEGPTQLIETDEVRARRSMLKTAFDLAKSKDSAGLQRAVEISRVFGVPVRQVKPNLPEFERAAEAAKFDPDVFYRDNRFLVDVMLGKPEQLAVVLQSPTVTPLIRAFRAVEDVWNDRYDWEAGNAAVLAESQSNPTANVDQLKAAREAGIAQAAQERKTETAKRRSALSAQKDTPEAQAIRAEDSTTAVLAQRYKEARAQTSMGYAGFDVMLAHNRPGATAEEQAEAEARVQDLRAAAQPLYLGETGATQLAGETLQGLISSTDGLLARGVTGLAGAAAGAVVGAASRNPGAVAAGARFGAQQGQRIGGAYHGFKAEAGSKYLELLDAKTDAGQRLTREEAMGGAVAYGLVAGYLETIGFEAQAAPLKAGLKRLLTGNPLFRRQLVELGKEWLRGAATEGITETLQASASQLFEFIVKSEKDWARQKGPIFQPEEALREGQAGALSGLILGGGSATGALVIDRLSESKAELTAPRQVELITKLAQEEAVKATPAEFAEIIAKATEETGAPVREFWVEAREVQRLFQEKGQDEGQMALELAEAAGPEAVDAFKAAVAEGGRFPVPIERVLTTWAESEVGKATLAHTTTSETGPTLAQVTDPKRQEEVQQGAQAIAEKMLAESADEQAFDDALGEMRQQMLDTGLVQPRQANDSVAVIRAWYETAKADNPQLTWKQLLERAGVLSFAKGDDAETGKTKVKAIDAFTDLRNLLDFGGRSKEGLDLEEKATLLFTDSLTNLRNLEAFEAVPLREGEQVAVITTPDAKAINDHPQGGHDVTNSLFRRMAAVVARIDGGAARVGTDFVLRVPSSEALDAAVAQVQAAMPPGMAVQGGLGATYDAARKDAGARIDAARAEGVLPARGATNYRGALEGVDFAAGVEMPSPSLANEHLAAVDAEGQYEGREKFAEKAFMDPKVPGLLNRLGFLHSKPAKYTVALDLRGLKDLNRLGGTELGDAVIQAFGERLVAMGGTAFAAAHLSGDEYALKSDSKEALVEFVDDLRADLLETSVREYGLPNGERVQHVTEFRDGLAEGDYGAADRELNRRKREEQQAPAKGDDRGTPGARPGGQGGVAVDPGNRVEKRNARAFARGSAPARPFASLGDRSTGGSSEQDAGAESIFGEGTGQPAGRVADGVLKADPEDLAEAKSAVGAMVNTARKRRFEAFLSYLEGTGPRPEDSRDGSLVAGLNRTDQLAMMRKFGLDDPEGSFGVEQPRRKKRDPNAKKSGWTDKGMQEKGRDAASAMNRARGKGPRTDRLYQAADLLRRVEEVKIQPTGGAKGTKATIVDVATALQRRTLKEFLKGKPIPANDFSDATKERISDWMVDEVAYEYEPEQQAKSGAGWYTQKFQDALDTLAGVFPELKQAAPRALFTAVVAVTSDGQTVQSNLRQAVDAWRAWKSGKGSLTAGEKGSYRGAIAKHLSELEELHHEYGNGLADWLLEEDTVGNLRRLAKEQGVDLSLSDYSADAVMPRAVLALGPKLGAFFANLMGRSGYLTMDRWWNRTFARYRGQILPTPTRSGLERFKKLLGNEKMDDEEALLAAAMAHFTYKERDYKDGSEIEKAGNTIAKAAFIELNDKPVGAKARDFMIATANDAVRKLGERGIDLTVADLQATLWYFEKRLYSTLGAEDSGEQSYADVVRQIAEEAGAQDAGRSKRAESRGVRREARQGGPAQANVPERLFQEGLDPRDEGSPAGHSGAALTSTGREPVKVPSPKNPELGWQWGEGVQLGKWDAIFTRDGWSFRWDGHKLLSLWANGDNASEVLRHALEAKVLLEDLPHWDAFESAYRRYLEVSSGGGHMYILDFLKYSTAERLLPFKDAATAYAILAGPLFNGQSPFDALDAATMANRDDRPNEVLPEDRMFQGASPVSSHRLSDGRNIIFDATGKETHVVLIDLQKVESTVEKLKTAWPVEPAPMPDGLEPVDGALFHKNLDLALEHLRDGATNMAEDAFRDAASDLISMMADQRVREGAFQPAQDEEGVDGLVRAREAWAFDVMQGNDVEGEQRVRRDLAPIESIIQALEERLLLTDARTGPTDEAPSFALKAADHQTLSVAADEFEAATGRMQQDETSMAGARGYFERPPPGAEGVARAMRVFLNKRADVSTVMHESAHGFLEMLGNLAEAEDAGPRTKQQWADVLKWLGVEKRSDIKREHHEKFARGFEAFLLEGKAPKKSLWGVFSRFKTWLTRIYRTVANLDVQLDDNVRRIFERMLATEDEIQRALGRRGKPAFDSAEEAGMTPEEWTEKQADEAEARDFATRDALAAHTRVALAEKERDWKDFVESQRPAAEAEFDARQDAKAKAWLEGRPKDLLDASVSPTPIVLDRKATQDAVGASAVKRFKTRAQGGVHPDEVAAVTGYATGREMLQAIASMPKRDAWVATRAEQLARESDAGNAQELDELRRQVRDGVQTYTEQRLLREMAELGRRAEPGDDVSPLGRQIALMQLKRAAGLIVEATPVGRLQPGRVLAKERAASKKVKEAMASGDFDASREWTRQQMLHALVHRATLDALRHRESFERLAEEMSSTDSRKRLGKASTVLRDAADVLLSRLGWPVDTEAGVEVLADLPAVFEESGGAPGDWFDAVTESGVLDIGDASRLTVAQLRAVDDGLRQIRAEARLRNETMVAEQRADMEATEAELLREASEVLPAKEAPGTGSSDSALDTVLAKASALDGFLLNPADLVRDLTGGNIDSTWWRTIIEPMRAAKHREAEFLKRAVLPVTEAIESLPASVRSRLREGVDGHALFPTHTKALQPPRQRHELLVLALNVGNEGNLQRLLDGRGITLEQVAKALDTLSDAELRWVEKVWDAVSELKKDAFDLEERQTGIRPRGVEAKPFALPSGRVLKGGYFPAVYDRRGSTTGERQQEQQVASLMQPGFVRPGTSHGYVKRRAERVTDSAISLDLGNIYRHLAQVAHDVAFREPIQSVGRLILRPAVQQALRERLGDAKARSFRRWLQDVGGNAGAEVTAGDSLVSWARGAGAHILLGYSVSTALGDIANLATALTGTPLKAKHLAAGLADFARAPVAARKAALEASPWLRTMVDNTRREFDRQLKTMLDRQLPKPLQWYKDNAFFFMEQVAVATTTPVWLGAHRQALQEGRTQDEAVRFADDVLSQVFPSHHPVDQAAILRDRAFWGRATIFYGYLSTAYRQQHRIIAPLFEQEFLDAGAGGKALTAAKVAGGLLGFWTAFSVLGELLMGRGPEAGDDDEDDPSPLTRWRNWYLRKLVAGPLSTQPFLPLSTAWEAAMTGKIAPSPRSGPLASIVTMIGKDFLAALDGEKAPLERVTSAAKVAVQALGLPLKPFTAQGSFLLDVATGGEVGGPGGAASGLIYGRRPNQPANIFQPGLE